MNGWQLRLAQAVAMVAVWCSLTACRAHSASVEPSIEFTTGLELKCYL